MSLSSESDEEGQPPARSVPPSPSRLRASSRSKSLAPPLPRFCPPPRPNGAGRRLTSGREGGSGSRPSASPGLSPELQAALDHLPSEQEARKRARGKGRADMRGVDGPSASLLRLFGGAGGGDPDDSEDGSDIDDAGDDFDPMDPLGVFGKARRAQCARVCKADLEDDAEAVGGTRQMAKGFLLNVFRSTGSKSVHAAFKDDVTFRSERNHRECLALARIIDAALRGDLRQLLELAVRRLAGVQAADCSDGNWRVCDAIEGAMERQSFLPPKFLQRALKTVVQMDALQQRGKASQAQKGHKKRMGKKAGDFQHSGPEGTPDSGHGASAQPGKKSAAAGGSGQR